jgi:hypothetical protein
MSLRGYVKKGKPAPWLAAFPEQSIKTMTKEEKVKTLRKFISPFSKKRQAASREYPAAARQFVKDAIARGETCPVFDAYAQLPKECQAWLRQPWDGKLRCTRLNEVHHKRGRRGDLLMDKRHWLCLSKWGHRLVHAFPKVARDFGWLCEAGQYNSPDKP